MKRIFKLTEAQLTQFNELLTPPTDNAKTEAAGALWERIAKEQGFLLSSVDTATTNDPHDFLAEPLPPAAAPVVLDERKGMTSASNALADSLCPGRHLAQAPIAEPPESEDAGTGKRIHAALAESTDSRKLNALSFAERETFDRCRDIEKALCLQYFGDLDAVKTPMRVFREERYWCRFTAPDGKAYAHSGMPDVVFRAGTRALVVDYKVLLGDVTDSPKNMQLRDLACLVKGHFVVLSEIAVAIAQPLVTMKPELCIYAAADLERAATEMMQRVVASNDLASPRVAGEAQCKFCRAKKVCAEYNRNVGANLPLVVEPVQQSLLFSVAMANWTPEQRGLAAQVIKLGKKRLGEAEEYLKACLEADPASVPGARLKPGNTVETITNPQGVFDRFAQRGGKLPDYLECVKVGKTALKEKTNALLGIKGKALDAEMKAMLDGYTESKQNAPSLELVKEGA